MIKEIYKRLGITAALEDEEKKFYNRLFSTLEEIDYKLAEVDSQISHYSPSNCRESVLSDLTFKLGVRNKGVLSSYLHPNSFYDNLVVSEVLLNILEKTSQGIYNFLNSQIKEAIANSVVDLGIIFENDIFIKRGAETLDRAAVLDSLDWLEDYKTTKEFFEGALTHYLRQRYRDSITNAYSALESIVKTVLDSDKRLDQSIPELVSKLNLPAQWNAILKHFCDYAHEFSSRHGKKDEDIKDEIDPKDAEAYIYFTGLMIRLIIQSI